MFIHKKPQELTVGKFVVRATINGVGFAIDHQSFRLAIEYDDEGTASSRLARNRWYKQQLEVALKRLAEFGNTKDHGRQSRPPKKQKARNAKQHRQGVRARPR